MLVEVLVLNEIRTLDRTFTYKLNEKQEQYFGIGVKVLVSFGIGDKLYEGFILGKSEGVDAKRIKEVVSVLHDDIRLSRKQLELASFVKERYLCSTAEAINTLVPKGTTYKEEITVFQGENLQLPDDLLTIEFPLKKNVLLKNINASKYRKYKAKGILVEDSKIKRKINKKFKKLVLVKFSEQDKDTLLGQIPGNAKVQKMLVEYLADHKSCEYSDLLKSFSRDAIKKLESRGLIEIKEIEAYRVPGLLNKNSAGYEFTLNGQQQAVFERIGTSMKNNTKEHFLIHGITGSGKTEVYMMLMEQVLNEGKQGIVLVPEISLTPQIVRRFHNKFGNNVAILHSKLSDGERYDQWRKIESGEISIIVGARSAIFAPCRNIGLIVIDEEHENTYKSDTNPKYRTVEVAEFISAQNGATLVLGSATPSIKTYHKAKNGQYQLLLLTERFNKKPLPPISVVDMRDELVKGNRSIFSEPLASGIRDRLEKGEQTILFLNRKGFSTFVSCRSCGYSIKCPKCDIAMTYHKKNNLTECSYCGHKIKVPKLCPECNSKYFKFFGTGTERVEEMVQEVFPDARIGRLDSVTTSRKGHLESIIKDVEDCEIDILVGTQMVTKGLDFKNVTLVGVLSADVTLNLPDFMSSERTFQLLTQVAGRAGRGDIQGEVVVQTYNPEHYSIIAASEQDFEKFYEEEIQIRQVLEYPPYKNIAVLLIAGLYENQVIKSANNVYYNLNDIIEKKFKGQFTMFGPNPAIFERLNNKYRWQILIKYNEKDRENLKKVIEYVCIKHKSQLVDKDSYISINIDAESIM